VRPNHTYSNAPGMFNEKDDVSAETVSSAPPRRRIIPVPRRRPDLPKPQRKEFNPFKFQ